MNKKILSLVLVISGIVILFILFLALSPFYTVSETEQAVITRFGNPIRTVKTAGLHLKAPGLDKANKLPKWILAWDGEISQFPTKDKRMILVDTTVRWRISEPLTFFKRYKDVSEAMKRLDDILDAASREVVSKNYFEEIVRNTNRISELDEDTINNLLEQGFTLEELRHFTSISFGRSNLSNRMKEYSSERLKSEGIEVIEFYVKKVNYIDDNLQAVYENMVAERNKIAQKYRSEGTSSEESIKGNIKKEYEEILAEGQRDAIKIKGEADSEAARIYNSAYNRNSSTRDFYEFLKKMEMYKKVSPNTSLIISTDSEFFDMFKKY